MRKIATHSLHTLQSKRNTYYQFSLAAIVISQIAHIQNFLLFFFFHLNFHAEVLVASTSIQAK